jgi:hypothetical protein
MGKSMGGGKILQRRVQTAPGVSTFYKTPTLIVNAVDLRRFNFKILHASIVILNSNQLSALQKSLSQQHCPHSTNRTSRRAILSVKPNAYERNKASQTSANCTGLGSPMAQKHPYFK